MAANENPNPLWAALVKRCAANTDITKVHRLVMVTEADVVAALEEVGEDNGR